MKNETERALRLHSQLIRAGVDPELAELYTAKHALRLEDTEPDALATEVLQEIPERLKAGGTDAPTYDPVADGKARGAAQRARNENPDARR
jgi:hypothetical protein